MWVVCLQICGCPSRRWSMVCVTRSCTRNDGRPRIFAFPQRTPTCLTPTTPARPWWVSFSCNASNDCVFGHCIFSLCTSVKLLLVIFIRYIPHRWCYGVILIEQKVVKTWCYSSCVFIYLQTVCLWICIYLTFWDSGRLTYFRCPNTSSLPVSVFHSEGSTARVDETDACQNIIHVSFCYYAHRQCLYGFVGIWVFLLISLRNGLFSFFRQIWGKHDTFCQREVTIGGK